MDDVNGNNFYGHGVGGWHKKGFVTQEDMTAVQVMGRMTPVEFALVRSGFEYGGRFIPSQKGRTIIRAEGNEVHEIGTVRDQYVLHQPVEYAQLFDENVRKPVETLGFLGSKADRLFITWNLPTIDVHGDEVKTYGFMPVGFDGKFGEKLFITKVRVVCANTWSAAVLDAQNSDNHGRAKGSIYSGKHNHKNHLRDLGIWMKYMTEQADRDIELYKNLYNKMEATPITKSIAWDLFCQTYPVKQSKVANYYPDELRDEANERLGDKAQAQQEKRELAMSLFEGAGIAITPTVWGALNSVTEAENHHVPSKKDIAESILYGNRANTMMNALHVMAEYVEAR